jgi:hypothetical protein
MRRWANQSHTENSWLLHVILKDSLLAVTVACRLLFNRRYPGERNRRNWSSGMAHAAHLIRPVQCGNVYVSTQVYRWAYNNL